MNIFTILSSSRDSKKLTIGTVNECVNVEDDSIVLLNELKNSNIETKT